MFVKSSHKTAGRKKLMPPRVAATAVSAAPSCAVRAACLPPPSVQRSFTAYRHTHALNRSAAVQGSVRRHARTTTPVHCP
jgi:hypothetical protein